MTRVITSQACKTLGEKATKTGNPQIIRLNIRVVVGQGGGGKQCSTEKYSLDLVHHGSVDRWPDGHPGLFLRGQRLVGAG